MKLGIMTFHWATNYGAILQAYCLQEYLREHGHDVEIINYKPKSHDTTWFQILRSPRNWLSIRKLAIFRKKENLLQKFREAYLLSTKRYKTISELEAEPKLYDAIISGSDQVLNPSFLKYGEDRKQSTAYFLTFAKPSTKKIGYAVSFGCSLYPKQMEELAAYSINSFDSIGVRECTGLDILSQLHYNGPSQVVPDPTVLYGKKLFAKLGVNVSEEKEDYTCVYMLRKEMRAEGPTRYIDEKNTPITMEEWLSTISHARVLITNSYHGMIMAILSHTSFIALIEKTLKSGSGMNDRFYTLLKRLGLESRIANDDEQLNSIIQQPIDWCKIDSRIEEFRKLGVDYLNSIIEI